MGRDQELRNQFFEVCEVGDRRSQVMEASLGRISSPDLTEVSREVADYEELKDGIDSCGCISTIRCSTFF
jgi:hypothetical protein